MQRIITVLKASEAMAVRQAVCMAGAEGVVITPVPFFPCDADRENGRFEQPTARSEVQVRLEVMADEIHCGGIVSAIQRVTQAGKIVLDSRRDMLPRHAAQT